MSPLSETLHFLICIKKEKKKKKLFRTTFSNFFHVGAKLYLFIYLFLLILLKNFFVYAEYSNDPVNQNVNIQKHANGRINILQYLT